MNRINSSENFELSKHVGRGRKSEGINTPKNRRDSEIYMIFQSVVVCLVGIALILVGSHYENQIGIWGRLLGTIGITLFVVVVVNILQRYLILRTFFEEVHTDITEVVNNSLHNKFELLNACDRASISTLHPDVSVFYANHLPVIFQSISDSFIASGTGLTTLTQSVVRGSSRKIVLEKLDQGKLFTFCFVTPHSKASRWRNQELDSNNVADDASQMSYNFLKTLGNESKTDNLKLMGVSDILPKSTLLRIDKHTIFWIPYFLATPTAFAFVIETHEGTPLFQHLNRDIERILKDASTFNPPQEKGSKKKGRPDNGPQAG